MSYTLESPKPIEMSFTFRNFLYRQKKREGNIAMYEVVDGKTTVNYEVIVIKIAPGGLMFGKMVEPYERYPSDSDFGSNGWGFQRVDDADKKFLKLVNSANNTTCDVLHQLQ